MAAPRSPSLRTHERKHSTVSVSFTHDRPGTSIQLLPYGAVNPLFSFTYTRPGISVTDSYTLASHRGHVLCMACHTHVCMYVRMYVCMDGLMHACLYACMRVCVSICMDVYMCVCMRVCVHAGMRACSYACMHVCVYACMRVCVNACICMQAHVFVCCRACQGTHTLGNFVHICGSSYPMFSFTPSQKVP